MGSFVVQVLHIVFNQKTSRDETYFYRSFSILPLVHLHTNHLESVVSVEVTHHSSRIGGVIIRLDYIYITTNFITNFFTIFITNFFTNFIDFNKSSGKTALFISLHPYYYKGIPVSELILQEGLTFLQCRLNRK